VFGGVVHGGCRAVKNAAKPHDAVMRGSTVAGPDGNRRGVAAFALLFGQRRDKVFAYRYGGVINVHKILRQVFVPA